MFKKIICLICIAMLSVSLFGCNFRVNIRFTRKGIFNTLLWDKTAVFQKIKMMK